jgi:hypothetical protein
MTPSPSPSPNVAPAAPFAVVSTAVHDREWWAEEAVTWHELNRRDGAPQATVEALMFSMRSGIDALREPSTLRRLAQLDVSQAQEVAERVRKFKPEIAPAWELDAVEALLEIWMKRHAR